MSYPMDFSQQRNGGHPGASYDNPSFNVHYLGAAMLSQMSTGLGTLQKPLKDLYFAYQKPSGCARLNANQLTVMKKGLIVSQIKDGGIDGDHMTGANVFYAMPSIHFWEAVRFVPVREKDKKYKCAFESLNVDLSRNLDNLYFPLDFKKEKHLTKIVSHPVLFAIVLRRPTGLKALDLHAFVCASDNQAMALVQHLNHAHSTFSDDEVHESGVFGYNLFGGNPPRELQNNAPDADPRVNQRRNDVARSASHLGTPSSGMGMSFQQLPPRPTGMSFQQQPPQPMGYALTQGDLIGGPSPNVMESVYGDHRDFNPRSDPRQQEGPQRSAVNRSYTVYQTRSEVLQPNAVAFDNSRPQPYQNQFERFGEPSGQIYGNHQQFRQNEGLSQFSTRPLGSAALLPPSREDIYGRFGQVNNRQGQYEYTQSLGQLNGDANRGNYPVERGFGEPKQYEVTNANNHFPPNPFDARPAAPVVIASPQKQSTSPSYRRKFPAPDPSDELGIYRLSVPVNKVQNDGNKLGQDRRNEPLYNNQKPLPDIPHPQFPIAAVSEQNRPKPVAVPEPTPARLPPAIEEEPQSGAARKSVFGIFPREPVKQAAAPMKFNDKRIVEEVTQVGEVRGEKASGYMGEARGGEKPVALVQPRKVQGIRVLPLGGEDIYGQLSKPDVRKNADDRRPLANENQRFEPVYNSDPPRSKVAPSGQSGVVQKPTSASAADNAAKSNSGEEENLKDKEIASIFGNINFDKTLSPPQQTNFESSLGYLP